MRKNAAFVLLTAAIVVLGAHAMELAELFGMGSSDKRLVKRERIVSSAVILSDRLSTVDPFEMIDRENAKAAEDQDAMSVATALVRTMAYGIDSTSIAWGVYSELYSSWMDGGNGFIFIDGWTYINGNKTRRRLDCIVDTSDYSVVYIRFYSEGSSRPSAEELNRGLERLDGESREFYTDLPRLRRELAAVAEDAAQGADINGEDPRSEYYGELDGIYRVFPVWHSKLLLAYIHRSDALRSLGEWLGMSRTALFWLPVTAAARVDIETKYHVYSDENEVARAAAGVENVLAALEDCGFEPTYSADNGRIYQSIPLDGKRLTVIYSVDEDMIEGYYFR